MRFWKLLPLLASSLCFAAQSDRVAGTIDANQMVRLSGHLHRKALPQYDQGRLPSSSPISQVMLLTLPSASQQQALRRLVAEQQDPRSPNFHKWITPQQYADRFGLNQNDVQKITAWLKSQGLHVDNVANGRNWIVFSGTAAQVENAFRTELHRYNVDGETHFANSIMPSVPVTLAGIATGIQGLDDFHPKPAVIKKSVAAAQKARPDYYDSSFPAQFVAPGDIETIYDLTPLYNATPKIDGTGQKLVIAGQTDVYLADLNDFRTGFGLPAISGCSTDVNGVITATACNTSNFQ
jgi:subtilase family serine protease